MISCTSVHTTCTSERGTELIRVSENCTRWSVTLLEPLFAEASSRAACVQATLKKITAEKRALGKTASKANGKKMAAAMKKAGKGIFAPKKLSDALAAVCGAKTLPRTEVTKKVPASLMTERACSKRVAESSHYRMMNQRRSSQRRQSLFIIEYNRIVAEREPAEVWVYIKKHGLNNGRTIKPDSTLKAIFPVPSPRCSS